jgi:hypothetical protein
MRKRPKLLAASIPKKTGVLTARRAICDAPVAQTSGTHPNINAMDVIITALKRIGAYFSGFLPAEHSRDAGGDPFGVGRRQRLQQYAECGRMRHYLPKCLRAWLVDNSMNSAGDPTLANPRNVFSMGLESQNS